MVPRPVGSPHWLLVVGCILQVNGDALVDRLLVHVAAQLRWGRRVLLLSLAPASSSCRHRPLPTPPLPPRLVTLSPRPPCCPRRPPLPILPPQAALRPGAGPSLRLRARLHHARQVQPPSHAAPAGPRVCQQPRDGQVCGAGEAEAQAEEFVAALLLPTFSPVPACFQQPLCLGPGRMWQPDCRLTWPAD